MAGIAWQVLKQLVFSFVLFWPGWLMVKMITPRPLSPLNPSGQGGLARLRTSLLRRRRHCRWCRPPGRWRVVIDGEFGTGKTQTCFAWSRPHLRSHADRTFTITGVLNLHVPEHRVWIITEWNGSVTTIRLPEEY